LDSGRSYTEYRYKYVITTQMTTPHCGLSLGLLCTIEFFPAVMRDCKLRGTVLKKRRDFYRARCLELTKLLSYQALFGVYGLSAERSFWRNTLWPAPTPVTNCIFSNTTWPQSGEIRLKNLCTFRPASLPMMSVSSDSDIKLRSTMFVQLLITSR
jgi:hypothetical protein